MFLIQTLLEAVIQTLPPERKQTILEGDGRHSYNPAQEKEFHPFFVTRYLRLQVARTEVPF